MSVQRAQRQEPPSPAAPVLLPHMVDELVFCGNSLLSLSSDYFVTGL
jgi:hypothetical protein